MDNCKYYDAHHGWCSHFTDYSTETPMFAKCFGRPCSQYTPKVNILTINTKLKVNDEVYLAYYFYDTYYPCRRSGRVSEIQIKIGETAQTIEYRVAVDCNGEIFYEQIPERRCFATYEECDKWCEEHNKRQDNSLL